DYYCYSEDSRSSIF
nr:immunoglobulin light chain junction region [Macaca mulatta]MOV73818.1 immunoglobulin light chain junction region [Macaca mulatta]